MRGHKHERRPGVWSLVVPLGRDGNGKLRQKWSTYKGGERGAQRELNRLLAEADAGRLADPNKQTVATFLRRWLTDCARPKVAPKTYERYAEIVEKHIIPALGGYKLTKLNPQQIQAVYSEWAEAGRRRGKGGLSARTIGQHHAVLRAALNKAVDWDLIPRNPANRVTPPQVEHREMQALDEAQMVALFNALHGKPLYMPVVIAGCTGLRRGEVLAMRWEDLDLQAGTLTVRRSLQQLKGEPSERLSFKGTKNKTNRTVELPGMLIEALQRHKGEQAAHRLQMGAAYQNLGLVCCREDGQMLVPDQVTRSFKDTAERLGLGIRFHDLRHSHASQLLKLGENIKMVSERLGHTSAIVTWNTYSHVLPGMGRAAANRFDEALRRAAG